MKIVIDIPKKQFDEIQKSNFITVGEIYAKKLINYIKKGAPLEQEPKTGHWIEHEGNLIEFFECDQCHHTEEYATNYCPNCGAKMQ